jgi:N-acetylglucosaminyl-diphospho-decaprenol L-rhamnosyltransferase
MPNSNDARADHRPRLSVIVVFWNGKADAPPLIASLQRCREALAFPMEVIAVDNASTDGTADWVEQNAPWVRLIRHRDNVGFAGGCNAGLLQARGEVQMLLNPDCEAEPEALADLVRILTRHKRIGMAACRLLNADGMRQFNHYSEPGPLSYIITHSMFASIFTRLRRFTTSSATGGMLRTDWLMGACLATRRDVVDRIGLMEESYFLYAEDTDWCRRARDVGYEVVLAPRTAIRHRQGTSASKRAEFAFRQLYRSLVRYTRLHHGPAHRMALSATMIADMVLRLPVYLILGRWERLQSAQFVIRMILRQDPDWRA